MNEIKKKKNLKATSQPSFLFEDVPNHAFNILKACLTSLVTLILIIPKRYARKGICGIPDSRQRPQDTEKYSDPLKTTGETAQSQRRALASCLSSWGSFRLRHWLPDVPVTSHMKSDIRKRK